MYSDREKRRAMALLDADLAADDITVEQYAREEARITAGSSRSEYLRRVSASANRTRVVRLAVVGAVAVLALLVLLIVLAMTGTTFDPTVYDDGN